MFQPGDTFPKTGQPVLEVLRSKHPHPTPPTGRSLDDYRGKPLAMVTEDITYVIVATVARQLLVSVEPGGVDSMSL